MSRGDKATSKSNNSLSIILTPAPPALEPSDIIRPRVQTGKNLSRPRAFRNVKCVAAIDHTTSLEVYVRTICLVLGIRPCFSNRCANERFNLRLSHPGPYQPKIVVTVVNRIFGTVPENCSDDKPGDTVHCGVLNPPSRSNAGA